MVAPISFKKLFFSIIGIFLHCIWCNNKIWPLYLLFMLQQEIQNCIVSSIRQYNSGPHLIHNTFWRNCKFVISFPLLYLINLSLTSVIFQDVGKLVLIKLFLSIPLIYLIFLLSLIPKTQKIRTTFLLCAFIYSEFQNTRISSFKINLYFLYKLFVKNIKCP